MYCEKKGEDCGYLGLMSEGMRSLPIERMAHEGDEESIIGGIEDVAARAVEYGPKADYSKRFLWNCRLLCY
ncbi:hypothetical protein BH23PAT2_BH23PAT2_05070 [soil metagenome]